MSVWTGDGNGTVGNPYLIHNWSELQEMMTVTSPIDRLSAYWKLTANIDASASSLLDDLAGWTSILNFAGNFDGNWHTISGLFINRPSTNYVGFFGVITSTAVVTKVGVLTVNITGQIWVGGLVGYNNDGNIANCHSSGAVTGNTGVGNLCGNNQDGNITTCYSTGMTIGSGHSVGGLCGRCNSSVNASTITNCYTTGAVTGDSQVGGLIGYYNGTTIANCYSSGAVTGNTNVGGFCGYNDQPITNCFYDKTTSGQTDTGKGTGEVTADMKKVATFTGWNFDDIWAINENNSYPYFFDSKISHLGGIAGVNKGDIVLCYADTELTGHNIAGGIIGDNIGGYIRCCISQGIIIGSDYVGGIAGKNSGLIHISYTTGFVSGNNFVGGFIGYNNGTILNCYINTDLGIVEGENYVGGFIGRNEGSINYCYSNSRVIGHLNTGGFCGESTSLLLTSCYYDSDTSHQSDNDGRGVPKSTINMKLLSTYENWDFDTVWGIIQTESYPYLVYVCASSSSSSYIDSPLLLYNTGVDNNGSVLNDGMEDSHYSLAGPSGSNTPYACLKYPVWVEPPAGSHWIGPTADASIPAGYGVVGTYSYTYIFNLTSTNYTISGHWAVDNSATIYLNNNNTGMSIGGDGFGYISNFSISSGFQIGTNTLRFDVYNGGGPTGLFVYFDENSK